METTVAVLNRAAYLIDEWGFCQGSTYTWPDGARGGKTRCAWGAIVDAWTDVTGERIGDGHDSATSALAATLGVPDTLAPVGLIANWNDSPERTAAEVSAKLREAAQLVRVPDRQLVAS